MAKIGVVLSGCGFLDGSEIHESVFTLLHIAELGHEAVCMAPNIDQTQVINYLTKEEMKEKRNVLTEAARITRGKIKDIKTVRADDLDALIFPGGFGAAKNLSTFAAKGAGCEVNPDVSALAKAIHAQGKPIGVICISPAVLAKIFEGSHLQLTIGNEASVAKQIELLGQQHVVCDVTDVCLDSKHKIVSTPAYMYDKPIHQVAAGVAKLVKSVAEFIEKSKQTMPVKP
ncbi:MAG: isoprenoid biosynthesis protein ElbB [Candidatus Omnitrophica bacterium CG11_big_fil_rev_8_21_14_0_20_45_26]|uniref:Isoprenoid biosynthesis protein ElbB n=1 Tax=Candidatus Abzuiibacterium crystallinum TaxID=1974748 RepID=A0A2H0LN73_9BACT|nr:MAG: isoprenoid biosynthesis protein ElbB [Candidatus Omnitrophica bacterium CG11_big_fil_rev_8_21_14_0_20_45_26]PIW65508.1 MAG: isoprenoid biosynthesis protein ElbB [Candidatus Omnitrophica bacterium CG12_big_fil_rev_8_21_14_0_65_45_16]